MCGIVGIIGKNKINKEDVEMMNEKIIHRGPDSSGSYFEEKIGLAMRRLKIIDLAGGDQPIFNENKNVLVFFNGEIYNFRKLREELVNKDHKFKTNSDTEVLVHGYEEWGTEEMLKKLEGMFAFCLYDKARKEIFIARDRFGEKPLYFFRNNNYFSFSSEVKALLGLNFVEKSINPTSLYYYLALHHVPERNTIIKNIFRLMPGNFLKIKTDNLDMKIKEYWRLEEKLVLDNFKGAKEKIKKLVDKSVKDRMIADVPVGAFLSGGIDSSIMVGLMSKYAKDLKTFSIGFKDSRFDESEFSKAVAKHFGTDHYHFLFSENEALDNLSGVINFMDEPIGDQAMLPVLLLSKEASKHVKVVLGGEGADEIFGGYSYYEQFSKKRSIKYLINLLTKKDGNFLNEAKYETSSGFPLLTNKDDRFNLIKKSEHKSIRKELSEHSLILQDKIKKINNPMKRAQYSDIYSWLVDDLLIKYDRMAMAASLEGRAPYLDSNLVEYAFNLQNKFKWQKQSKYILREAFKDLLPKKVCQRRKQGFILPMSEWFRGALKQKLLESADLEQNDFIDNDYYKKLIQNHISKREDRTRLLYSIFVYRLWFRKFIK